MAHSSPFGFHLKWTTSEAWSLDEGASKHSEHCSFGSRFLSSDLISRMITERFRLSIFSTVSFKFWLLR